MEMQNIIPYLKKAVAIPNYKLDIEFEDGTKKAIDLLGWVSRRVFKYGENEENLKKFQFTPDKRLQRSEDIEMDLDAFYLKLFGKVFNENAGNKQLLPDSHLDAFLRPFASTFSC